MNTIRQVEANWLTTAPNEFFGEEKTGYESGCHIHIITDNESDYSGNNRNHEFAPAIKALNIYEIMKTVSRCTGVPVKLMRSPSRRSSVVRARWVAMYMTRIKTQATLEEIGIAFNREHSSVIHGISTVKGDNTLLACARRIQAVM